MPISAPSPSSPPSLKRDEALTITAELRTKFGLDQLVPVTAERLEALAMAEQVKDKVSQLVRPDREARARWARAAEDAQRAPKRASEDQRLAQRWVADAAARVGRRNG